MMVRQLLTGIGLAAVVSIAGYAFVETWAYSMGELRTGTGAYQIVTTRGTTQKPFLYCTANPASATVRAKNGAGSTTDITFTCFNGLNHTVSLSASCAITSVPTATNPPACAFRSGNLTTIPANSSKSVVFRVTAGPGTSQAPVYTLVYSVSTSPAQSVDATFTETSALDVTN